MKKLTAVLSLLLCLALCTGACFAESSPTKYAGMSPEEIVAGMSLEQKAAQMVQPACYMIDNNMMQTNCYGSVLSQGASLDAHGWRIYVGAFQSAALTSDAGIPFIYGQDDVHGVNYCRNTVLFPHNIGLGAANDEELMYQVGLITADEAKLCHMLLNFSPCVAQSVDPRWGRTYESYGSDLTTITRLSTAYTRGMLDSGLVVCVKHYFGDGNVRFGTGEGDFMIDRGDAQLTEEEIQALLAVYQAQIDAGVQVIMISHSSLNGLKMHENKAYIDLLKNEMGFNGFILSDWDSIQHIAAPDYETQVVVAVNSGIDMLMEAEKFDTAKHVIVEAVLRGDIPMERVDDAVTRIIRVKMNAGIFDDPFFENLETRQTETGSAEYRAVAEKLVEESLVLIKNEGDVLPLKAGTAVYIMGPAANDDAAQCGGWTVGWQGSDTPFIPGVTSIKEGFQQKAEEYGITLVSDPAEADVVLLAVGEQPYAEWYGDTANPDLCGSLGLEGNRQAIEQAKGYGKPVVACIVAGRHVFIGDYIDDWDAVVMCYLPGSEGQGVANVLCGKADFTGRLPSPWYRTTEQIDAGTPWLEVGYGLPLNR